jgi:hypothetical protein
LFGDVEVEDRPETYVLASSYLDRVGSDYRGDTSSGEANPWNDLPAKAEPPRRIRLVHRITPSAASATGACSLKIEGHVRLTGSNIGSK